MRGGQFDLGRCGQGERCGVGVVEHHPAVAARDRAGAGPDDLAGGQQFVEHGRLVVAHPRRQDQRFDRRGGDGGSGDLFDHAEQAVHPAGGGRADLLPGRQEPGVRARAHRLHLGAQRGQRPSSQDPQYFGVAPLLGPVDRVDELAAHQRAVQRHPAEHVGGHPKAQPEPGRGGDRAERTAGAGVAADQLAQRVGHRFGETGRHPHRHRHPDGVAQPADVLHSHPPGVAGVGHRQDPSGRMQTVEPRADAGSRCTLGDFDLGQWAEQAQQVGYAFGVAGAAVLGEVLQLPLGGDDHVGLQQFAQFHPAEKFGQQRGVQRERRRTALGQRAVAFVHERPDVAEHQRCGERRGSGGLHLLQLHPALGDPRQQIDQRRYVVDVL